MIMDSTTVRENNNMQIACFIALQRRIAVKIMYISNLQTRQVTLCLDLSYFLKLWNLILKNTK